MFDNCKNCLLYDRRDDEDRRFLNDVKIVDDPNPDKHFCDMWDEENSHVIPKEVWENKTKCKFYVKDRSKN